jgi:hypothetical protein
MLEIEAAKIAQDRTRQRQSGREEIRRADDHRSHQNQHRFEEYDGQRRLRRRIFQQASTSRHRTSFATPGLRISAATTTRCKRSQGRGVAVRALCKSGDNAKLKDCAGKMLALQHHLEMTENLDKKRD